MHGASATKTVDLGSIPGRVKLKTKNGYSQLGYLTLCVKPPSCILDRRAAGLKERKVPSLSLYRGNLVNEYVIAITLNRTAWTKASELDPKNERISFQATG